jgi:hypothetical protein
MLHGSQADSAVCQFVDYLFQNNSIQFTLSPIHDYMFPHVAYE